MSQREQPELHVVGEILGASDFPLPSLLCKFSFESGSNFRLLQGLPAGQTHCDTPPVRMRALTERPAPHVRLGAR